MPNKAKCAKIPHQYKFTPLSVFVVNTAGLRKAASQEIRAGQVTSRHPGLPPRLPLLPSPSLAFLHVLLTERIWAALVAWANKPWQVYHPASWKAISWNLPGWNWGVFQRWWIKTVFKWHIGGGKGREGGIKKNAPGSQSTVLISREWQKWQKGPCTSEQGSVPRANATCTDDWSLFKPCQALFSQ